MIARLVASLREAEDAPRIRDPEVRDREYATLRNHVLYGSMAGYALFYFCRKNLSVAMDGLKGLGYSFTDLGQMSSLNYITYGVSKLLFGLVADRARARVFVVGGLVLSALLNVAFGLSTEIAVLSALWAANGVVQAAGAPASAKLIAQWFSLSERGTKTGIWNISHQGGGGVVLVLAGFCAAAYGWRGAMILPAVIALLGAVLVARHLHDRPEACGLPPVEEHRRDAVASEEEARREPWGRVLVRRVLLNPRVWVIALASGCTYVVRYGALDWTPLFLTRVRGTTIASAGLTASLLELVGIPGALLCGWLSDRVFGARRAPVVLASLLFLASCTWLLPRVPPGHPWLDASLLAAIGFFTYGPQLLLAGVAPVDMSSKRVAAAAVGFTGLMSYAGATLSSRATGWLVDALGWRSAFDFWAIAALAGALLCMSIAAAERRRSASSRRA